MIPIVSDKVIRPTAVSCRWWSRASSHDHTVNVMWPTASLSPSCLVSSSSSSSSRWRRGDVWCAVNCTTTIS